MWYLGVFFVESKQENCLVKITEGKAQVNRFLLHFHDARNLLQNEAKQKIMTI